MKYTVKINVKSQDELDEVSELSVVKSVEGSSLQSVFEQVSQISSDQILSENVGIQEESPKKLDDDVQLPSFDVGQSELPDVDVEVPDPRALAKQDVADGKYGLSSSSKSDSDQPVALNDKSEDEGGTDLFGSALDDDESDDEDEYGLE